MEFNPDMLRVYAITDRECLKGKDMKLHVELAIQGGATMIQLREKNIGTEELAKIASELVPVCHRHNVPLIVNDDWKAGVISGADGVHVGLEDTSVAEIRANTDSNFIIGATAKTVEQAQKAEKQGADYIGTGAVFPSPTKTNAVRITSDELRTICRSVNIPAVAIGGITKDNLWELRNCGNKGIAVVSTVFGTDNPYTSAKELAETWALVCHTKTALTIAGSDCSGGAGIQADIKTMQANGVYAMSAITALTAQNTTGVSAIHDVPAEFVAQQIDMVFSDIRPDAVKIGMISSAEVAEIIADRLKYWNAENIVVDPVAVATSGSSLSNTEAYEDVKNLLFPISALVTPNIPEAELITGMKINSREDIERTAGYIYEKYGCSVLVKGGHSVNDSNDYLYTAGIQQGRWFEGRKIDNPNTHGTGCTLSSAIASNLAKGYTCEVAVMYAKQYINSRLMSKINLGKGSGPLNHGFYR
ncbi:MAG: bifunctional hydroxymethylpyrimidine kinase/phosphomethylpyrimidine kinase [Ruminococcus flavefaciens]|nr:bifunctional hydroxymethylpyrimidine kinase/phosphomethylpyrimidine kinase [Ruminococcus flavefaciens]MCM1229159.1 bifunctional hydroxymethylpyrimidine kinase/phosphomethylpyrimidine kinase [Ruminococcus flavefaciens]